MVGQRFSLGAIKISARANSTRAPAWVAFSLLSHSDRSSPKLFLCVLVFVSSCLPHNFRIDRPTDAQTKSTFIELLSRALGLQRILNIKHVRPSGSLKPCKKLRNLAKPYIPTKTNLNILLGWPAYTTIANSCYRAASVIFCMCGAQGVVPRLPLEYIPPFVPGVKHEEDHDQDTARYIEL